MLLALKQQREFAAYIIALKGKSFITVAVFNIYNFGNAHLMLRMLSIGSFKAHAMWSKWIHKRVIT